MASSAASRISQNQYNRQSGGFTSLAPFLRHLTSLELTVELKNGRRYRGLLHDADDYMNLVLHRVTRNHNTTSSSDHTSDTSRRAPNERQTNYEDVDYQLLHIRGSSIRYVHLPDEADVPFLIKAGMDRARSAKDKYARGKRTV